MLKENGLGENSGFSAYHPIVNLIYFLLVIGITMFSTSPLFLALSFGFAWIYSVLLKGRKAIIFNIVFFIPILIIMAIINALFTHNGETVLFYLNTQRVTLEAFIFGIVAAVLITSVVIWFSCFNVIMTSDKFVYLFGRAAPALGLTVSMIFRFIPLLKERYKEISMGQKCMGRDMSKDGIMKKVRQFSKEISILISWSLEASIETADSMEARGYGLKGRTSFHLFKFRARDWMSMGYMGFTGGISVAACIIGKTSIYYYPKVEALSLDMMTIISAIAYVLLLVLPVVIDIREEQKWTRLNLNI